MASRKETPDVLGELLGGAAPRPPSQTTVDPEHLSGEDFEPALVEEPAPAPRAEVWHVSPEEPTALPQAQPEAGVGASVEPTRRRKAPSRQTRTNRTRWEYVEIVFYDHYGFRPRFISGLESRNWKKAPLIYDYLNYLGEQGWELAGIAGRHKDQVRAYLKRPKF